MPYRIDRNRNGGGIILIRDDIPSRVLTRHVFPDDIEGLFIELNFKQVVTFWNMSRAISKRLVLLQ